MIGTKAQARREQRVAEIVATAWELARAHGIGGLSLHALARELGIRQPSLYAYFESKHALYDAMFADGNRQLIARLDRQNTTPMDALAYRFDIVLRGRRSTLFENRPEGN